MYEGWREGCFQRANKTKRGSHPHNPHLEQLEHHQPRHRRRRGGNGRNDAAGHELRLRKVRVGDRVVVGAHVGRGGDEIDVEVEVVVLDGGGVMVKW